MSMRIDKDKREEIRERAATESVRSLAREFNVAPGTILKWRHREDRSDRPRNPKGPPGLSDFEKAVFREMVRLTGYSRSRLFEYLEPVWGKLPSQARQELEDEPSWQIDPRTHEILLKPFHPRTFLREMKESGLDRFRLDPPEEPGTLAAHKVQIRWRYANGSFADGEILLLLERFSGALYAKAFTGEVGSEDIVLSIKQFERMLGNDFFQIYRVAPESAAPIHLEELPGVTVIDDPPSPPPPGCVELPGTFANKHALNWHVKDIVNRINLTERHYYVRDSKREMTPYKRYLRLLPSHLIKPGSERRQRSRMRLIQKEK